MGVTFSTDTDTAVVGSSTYNYDIQEFSISGDPEWRKNSDRRRTWKQSEDKTPTYTDTHSIFYASGSYAPDNYTNIVLAWDDDDPARAIADLWRPGTAENLRVTSLDIAGNITYSVFKGRDRNNLLAYIGDNVGGSAIGSLITSFNGGPHGHLVDASGATRLADWFYPTPSHLKLMPDSGGTAYVMSSVAPTNARNYVQPYLQRNWQNSSSPLFGIGGYASNDGLRLLSSTLPSRLVFVALPFPHFETRFDPGLWIRPGVPCQPLQSWYPLAGGDGSGDVYHAAYGLPPVELSGTLGVVTGNPAPEVKLYLTQHKADLTTIFDTLIASVTMNYDSTSGGFDWYVLQPTDSGHTTTLDADTLYWSLTTNGTGNLWHKIPCHVQPYALSSVTDGVSAYLPGSLYDPFA